MKRYMLLPEDSIELLRAQDEAEAGGLRFSASGR